MEFKDFVTFEPKSVLIFRNEDIQPIFYKELYGPILAILRKGPMTLEEIKKEYPKHSDRVKSPPDKTLYRHLKILKEAGMVAEAGRRVYDKQTLTQKLFCRTAKLFYFRPEEESAEDKERRARISDPLSELLKVSLKSDKPTSEGLLEVTEKIGASNRKSHDVLFKDRPDEVAKILEGVSSSDVKQIVEYFWIIRLLLEKSDFEEDIKKYLS